MNLRLKQEILKRITWDRNMREALESQGLMSLGYHPEMEKVHVANAVWLEKILDEVGFPTSELVGQTASEAVCQIILHAISLPEFQKRGLEMIRQAAQSKKIPWRYVAYLEDRISVFEGKPQIYGTHADWTREGDYRVTPVQDASGLNLRREKMGLAPIDLTLSLTPPAKEVAPENRTARNVQFLQWAKRVGWRK